MDPGPVRSEVTAPRARALAQLLPAAAVVALLCALGWAHHRRLDRTSPSGDAPETLWVDPGQARVARAPGWADPRWLERVRGALADEPPFAIAGPAPLAALAERLGALSFVERVERCALGPSGLELELALREPVACIPVGAEFALVDEDGVVLEGRWPLPPRLGRVFLPVLGPLDDALFARARAGDWLVEPEHTGALDVALSLAANLSVEERAALGRIVIDARGAQGASVSEPGVRLELEGARLALFGRAPSSGEPGELAARRKWQALVRALELFERDPEGGDWDLVDLRWDRPELALRSAPAVAALDGGARPAAASSRHAHAARDESRPWVR